MLKTYLKFPSYTGKSHLPNIISRRQRIGTGRHNIAYKTDGDDDDDATKLEKKLKQLESALEGKLTKAAKDLVVSEIASVNTTLESLKQSIGKPDAETTKKLGELETLLKEIKKAADLNQPVIDAFVVNKDKKPMAEKSFADNLKEAVEAAHDDIQKFVRKEKKSLSLELKVVADVSTANVTGGTVWGAQYRPGIITNPNQIGHIRNVMSVSSAGPGTDYYFMRENGAGEGSIAPTSEKKAAAAVSQATGLKPQFDLDLLESSVKFENIAGWMLMSRKAMANIPGFVNFLQKRVPEKLMDVEDAQILYGDGASPNLKGITHADNSVVSTSTATVLAEAIIDDIATLEDTYKRLATVILLRPLEYHSFFKNKAAGSGEYDLPANVVFVNGVLFISGVPAFKTTALNAGTYIVGDFAFGAELLIQEGMRLEFFEQDSTNVRTNQVTLRIEETVALPVFAGDHFIVGEVPVVS